MSRDFHHPYEPYQIQLDLMNALYDCIQNKQIGIFESPTDADEPEWVVEQLRKEKRDEFLARKEQIERHLAKIREKEASQKRRLESGEPPRKRVKQNTTGTGTVADDDEAAFLIDDYESDQESFDKTGNGPSSGLSSQTLDVLAQLGMVPGGTEAEGIEYFEGTKVFYCSRTHSQLSQLASEVRKLSFPAPASADDDHATEDNRDEIKYLTLGSRKNLCINPKVNRLESAVAINEKCLHLQQSKEESGKCPYVPKPENELLVHSFRDHAIAKVRDIEDLANLGKKVEICPYYASRAAIRPSELVTLPYPLLLQKAARESLDLSLKDHVVIIDEAHNLMDAIAGIYSAYVTLKQLKLARAQLGVYLQKFRNKVKGKNRVYLAQIIRVIDSLTAFLEARECLRSSTTTTVPELLSGKGADQVDLYKLSVYLRESRLARKVDGYVEYSAQTSAESEPKPSMPVLCHIEGFLLALMSPSKEGKFFYETTEDGELQLKYLLLDPAFHFRDVVEEARSVILIGGTMSPMDEFIQQLFPYVDSARLRTLSCGHIIPDTNLMAWPVSGGTDGTDLDFTFEQRSQPKVLESLGKTLVALAQIIPNGLVIFFPSYSYLEQCIQCWKTTSSGTWTELGNLKKLFTDSKESGKVDDILRTYSDAVFQGNGAMLFSVVGGKMSEGINFSDELGRGIVIVGLPFPNANSIEWKTKMQYVQDRTVSRGRTQAEGAAASRAMYENACMRAVNQSIGRAIRHQKDYASIFMLDRRYATPRIQDKLPGWIQKRVMSPVDGKKFGEMVRAVQRFFVQPRG